MDAEQTSHTHHATCVCVDGRAGLILGASGSGKSSLALQLAALGAQLVADDRTLLTRTDGGLVASAPTTSFAGCIEARGVGILRLPHVASAPVVLVVDLDQSEDQRLPEPHRVTLLGVTLPCLWRASGPHFAAAVLHCLRSGIPLRP